MRIIFHIDMNSYFASVEQQANPSLRGRPVGVCEHLGGIIIAPSVEAKRLGIKLGTTTWDARKIYPQIVLLPTDPDKYRFMTRQFMSVLRDYTDQVEQYSIDEAFLDGSEICKDYNAALLLALEIKQRLRLEVGEWVSCSIGIGPNKLIAKIAADLGQGDIDRICMVGADDIPRLYERLRLTDIPGIGKRLERALSKLNISSLRQLADYPLGNLLNQFGIWGYVLHQLANFDDASPIITPQMEGNAKSVGHAYTLPKATSNLGEIKKLMFKLAEKVGRRMRRMAARGRVIHYFHSDRRFEGFSKQRKIGEFINDGRMIYQAAYKIFKQSCHSRPPRRRNPVKIMGISVSGLAFSDPQEPLFEKFKRPLWLNGALDAINDKYGELTIRRGRLLGVNDEWARDTVGFSRMRLR